MVMQADEELAGLIIRCSEVGHGAKLVAQARKEGAQEVLAKLRDLDCAGIEAVIKNYNGGLLDAPDPKNSRGFTTHYRPREAMKSAITALADALQEQG